jgi:hypothetical protein
MSNTHCEAARCLLPRISGWPTPRSGNSGRPRFPVGYVLVECLVSLVLLAGAAALLQLIATTTSVGADRAIQTNHALEAVDVVHQRWIRVSCTSGGAPSGLVPPTSSRLAVETSAVTDGSLHRLTIRSAWSLSAIGNGPIGHSALVQRQVSVASRCDP